VGALAHFWQRKFPASRRPVAGAFRVRGDRGGLVRAGRRLVGNPLGLNSFQKKVALYRASLRVDTVSSVSCLEKRCSNGWRKCLRNFNLNSLRPAGGSEADIHRASKQRRDYPKREH
jgi:hypothetical protein